MLTQNSAPPAATVRGEEEQRSTLERDYNEMSDQALIDLLSEDGAHVRRAAASELERRKPSPGITLLDDVRAFIGKFVSFPDESARTAVTLWAVHAHLVEHLHVTPRLALLSPEAASGKTRVLEVLELLTPEAQLTLNASPSSIFRILEKEQITLLFDEVDAIWTKRGQDDSHEDLRALLNAGYKVGATIPRCVGKSHDVVRFPVFCAVALAGLGDLPETIMTRSIIVRMRRRAPHERVSEFRTRVHAPTGNDLRARLAEWAAEIGRDVGEAWPTFPDGVEDRPAELWEPLLAIADAAGGHWPDTARAACAQLCCAAQDRQASLGVRLLADLRTVFGDVDALHTETILDRLHHPEESGLDADAPWPELRGKPLDTRGLASMLQQYGVKPRKVRQPGGPPKKGYRRDDLWDAWQRYLPPAPGEGEQGEHKAQASVDAGSSVPQAPTQGQQGERAAGSDVPPVPQGATQGERHRPRHTGLVPHVPHVPEPQDGDRDDMEVIEL